MRNYFDAALKILTKVFQEESYSNRAVSDAGKVDDMTTKLVYGVLENNIYIEYTLNQLLNKKPQTQVYILLKIGAYALKNLSNVPTYAIVSECVETVKMNGKKELAGFVNAVLKRYAEGGYTLPKQGTDEYLSVVYSVPTWFVKRVKKEYGDAEKFLSATVSTRETARINNKITSIDYVKKQLDGAGVDYDVLDGFNSIAVPADELEVKKLFNAGYLTFQALSSQLAVRALAPKDGDLILDMCSAPGGKAVYIAELCPNSTVTACDIYAHRVELIGRYARRMQINNVVSVTADATMLKPEWINKFDYILLDAPCTCFGTYKKHPDVFLHRGEEDIKKIAETQKKLLDVAAQYLAKGGTMVYSTCTLFKEENEKATEYALSLGLKKKPFTDKFVKLTNAEEGASEFKTMPSGSYDGFYISRLEKI